METAICVIDAKTLVDHIQDVKRWIYNGQLRLVVPLSSEPNPVQYLSSLTKFKTSTRTRRSTLSKVDRDQAETKRTF